MIVLSSIIQLIPSSKNYSSLIHSTKKHMHQFSTHANQLRPLKAAEESLVVVGGGAAGIYGAIRAKSMAPHLDVVVIEKGRLLSKVKISGGGRCNVTNGHFHDSISMADNYPRGYRELKGSFFTQHAPEDTVSWFSQHGVALKVEDDGRVFPVSNSSSSVIECLLNEAKALGVSLQTGRTVTEASIDSNGRFKVKVENRSSDLLEHKLADYLLIASGSSPQGYKLARQLNHSIIEPMPSLFTFKIDDQHLSELSGISFEKVEAKLKVKNSSKNSIHLKQVGPMLITHWGLSGPVVLKLSAWGARDLFASSYEAVLDVDFAPDIHVEEVTNILLKCKQNASKQKLVNSFPSEFGIVKRFWKYVLDREKIVSDLPWSSLSANSLASVAKILKRCTFLVNGKGQFKDEFVTAGGVPLSEIFIDTMESRKCPKLFFAGEVLNVDGVTGGFNFQNAWSGGYIAGTKIAALSCDFIANETNSIACI